MTLFGYLAAEPQFPVYRWNNNGSCLCRLGQIVSAQPGLAIVTVIVELLVLLSLLGNLVKASECSPRAQVPSTLQPQGLAPAVCSLHLQLSFRVPSLLPSEFLNVPPGLPF